jgi:hypothetical protein
MKFQQYLVYFVAILFAGLSLSSCGGDDEVTPDAPSVTPPAITNAVSGEAGSIAFTVSVPGGYASSAVAATGGTASIVTEPAAGATSGTVEVSFTASIASGAASVTLTTTDRNGKFTAQVAVVNVEAEQTVFRITSNITADATWETGKTYILGARIAVVSGVTLTIQPGVVVKGEAGSGSNATALLIARGGKLMAEGTASQPIIFTSVADEIQPGQIASPNLDPSVSGLWGGLIVLGNAPISADAAAVQIEGIPASDQNGLYGGDNADDNSGVLKYISIRHGGANIGEGNEINGLTLGGVGKGTSISYIEVIGNQDDGIEFFGGTVDASHLIVWNAGDDLYDVDQAYSGTISNIIGILGSASDHAFELDGPEGTATGTFTITNGSFKGNTNADGGEYADLRSDVTCNMSNLYFFGFKSNADFELDNAGVSDNWANGEIVLSGLQFNVSHLTEGNTTIDAIFKDDGGRDADFNAAAAEFASIVTTPTVGATKAAFGSWTWSDVDGKLADFQ